MIIRVRSNVNLAGDYEPGELYDLEWTPAVADLISGGLFTIVPFPPRDIQLAFEGVE